MAEIVVADAGPLIAFGRLRRIDVLARVFETIVVPRAVFEETQDHPGLPDAQAIFSAHAGVPRARGDEPLASL